MARQTVVPELTDDEVARRLDAAEKDREHGRLVHCENEHEMRAFLQGLPHEA